jgi:hypothetical protein
MEPALAAAVGPTPRPPLKSTWLVSAAVQTNPGVTDGEAEIASYKDKDVDVGLQLLFIGKQFV